MLFDIKVDAIYLLQGPENDRIKKNCRVKKTSFCTQFYVEYKGKWKYYFSNKIMLKITCRISHLVQKERNYFQHQKCLTMANSLLVA